MRMHRVLASSFALACALSLHAAPQIQFATNMLDFGQLVGIEYITGAFKFKNAGDAPLKLEPPKPSCGCTDAKIVPDTLAPGQSGEVTFKIALDHKMGVNQKNIEIRSNDPKTPVVKLIAQLAYDPLYNIDTKAVHITVPVGKEQATESFNIVRTDNQTPTIDRVVSSSDLVSASFDLSAKRDDNGGTIIFTAKRSPQSPARFNAKVVLYDSKVTQQPVRTIPVSVDLEGELTATPRGLYWVFADQGSDLKAYPAQALTRSVQLKSVLGRQVEIKAAKCSIKGTSVQVTPKEEGKAFDLALKLDEVPHGFVTGKMLLETSLESQPHLEVPVTISVVK
jgi:hypothetical protein